MARIGIGIGIGIVAALAVLGWTSAGLAADLSPGLVPVAPGQTVVIDPVVAAPVIFGPGTTEIGPTPLEWLRYERPQEGRDVVLTLGGVRVRTIEWWEPVEVRVQTESGAALTERERAAIRAQAVVCDRGEAAEQTERTERNGTFVIEYRCVRYQGIGDQ